MAECVGPKLMLREPTNSIPCMRAAQMTRQGGREDEKKTRGKTKSSPVLPTPPTPSFFWLALEPGRRAGGHSNVPPEDKAGRTAASLVQREKDGRMTMAMMQKRTTTDHVGLIWLEL